MRYETEETKPKLIGDNLAKTSRNLRIAKMAMEGKSSIEIAKEVDIGDRQVRTVLNSPHIRRILEEDTEKHIVELPYAHKRHNELLDSKDEKIALSAISLKYDITGMKGKHTSPLIQQIYVDQRTVSKEAHQDFRDLLALKRERDLKEAGEKRT